MKILSNKKYDMLIIENESLKEIRENDNWCINMLWDKIKELEEKNKKLNDLNRELRRINNKIMDKLEQKTRLVNYYRREKAKRDRFIDLWDSLRIWECE